MNFNRIILFGFWAFFLIVFIAGICIYSDCLFTDPSCKISIDRATGFATFVGGILSGFTVILLLLTLRHQVNQSQKDEIGRRFFLMLDIHQKNVAELTVETYSEKVLKGKQIFEKIIDDFICIFSEVKAFRKRGEAYSSEQQIDDLKFCYELLYFGSFDYDFIRKWWKKERGSLEILAGNTQMSAHKMEEYQKNGTEVEKFIYYVRTTGVNISTDEQWEFSFFAEFKGYHNQLGHYFRHLFHMADYINKEKLLNEKEKYEYIKMLRTQLTNNEQKLFFLNSFFKYGGKWEFNYRKFNQLKKDVPLQDQSKLLVTNYKLIKNLPKGEVFDGVEAANFFPDIKFEDPEH